MWGVTKSFINFLGKHLSGREDVDNHSVASDRYETKDAHYKAK